MDNRLRRTVRQDCLSLQRLPDRPPVRTAHYRVAFIMGLAIQVVFFVLGLFPAWGSEAISEPKRPAYQLRRFDEDWSVLKGVDRTKTSDFWDLLKFVPITSDQNVWLSLGGQVRERWEYYHQFFFGVSAPEKSDDYLLSRFRLSADLHITPFFRIFAEGKSSLSTRRELQGGRTNALVDTADLQNGFGELMLPLGKDTSVTLRAGRQELLFGAQRLVGPSDWGGNVRRTFDGGTGTLRFHDWNITPFWAEFVPVKKHDFNESTSRNKLFGVYSTGGLHFLPLNVDLYWLDVNNKNAAFNGTAGRERRHTLGGRVWGKIGTTGLDFEVEGAGQFGTIGGRDIAAWMLTAILGYSPSIPSLSPRVYVEFDYASGDDKPGGDVETFNQLYPTGHSFLGYIDYIGRQNIISPNAGLTVSPLRGLSLSLQQYFFWRESDRDALYNKASGVIRSGTTTSERYVGSETDFYATYNFDRHILVYGGYSHFFPGDFIDKTGPDKGSDFLYAAIQYTF